MENEKTSAGFGCFTLVAVALLVAWFIWDISYLPRVIHVGGSVYEKNIEPYFFLENLPEHNIDEHKYTLYILNGDGGIENIVISKEFFIAVREGDIISASCMVSGRSREFFYSGQASCEATISEQGE